MRSEKYYCNNIFYPKFILIGDDAVVSIKISVDDKNSSEKSAYRTRIFGKYWSVSMLRLIVRFSCIFELG